MVLKFKQVPPLTGGGRGRIELSLVTATVILKHDEDELGDEDGDDVKERRKHKVLFSISSGLCPKRTMKELRKIHFLAGGAQQSTEAS